MAKDKTPAYDVEAIAAVLEKLPSDQMDLLLKRTGQQPSTQGFTPEMLATILQTVGRDTAISLKKAGQRENPDYPARSVYNPRGKFDDEGHVQEPKLTFLRDTYFGPVLIGRAGMTADLLTEPEIALYNRFEKDMDAHHGTWTARFSMKGDRKRLVVDVPMAEPDDRMGLPPLSVILLTLLEGEESVNPATLLQQVKDLRAEMADMRTRNKQQMPQDAPVEAHADA